jgi:hypothetical protein
MPGIPLMSSAMVSASGFTSRMSSFASWRYVIASMSVFIEKYISRPLNAVPSP